MSPDDPAPRLLMVAPAPVIRRGDDILLDGKFAEGMVLQSHLWPGVFDCVLREGARDIPFGACAYDGAVQGFGLTVLAPDEPLSAETIGGYDLLFCSADDARNFHIPALARAVGTPVATTLEYTLETRLKIAMLEPRRSLPRRLYSALKLIRQERSRRAFLSAMVGIQANGYPAWEVCKAFDPDTLLFLDNRMTDDLFVTEAELQDKQRRLMAGEPLRLVYSGRLEPMKGAHHLVPVATHLRDLGVPFVLEIFGAGSLEQSLKNDIGAQGLDKEVLLHGAVDFESDLVPHLRQNSDLYLCCHLQSDPSCSYLENMGCGLAVAGYDNRMWSALAAAAQAGWVAPSGRPRRLAAQLAGIEKDRAGIVRRMDNAAGFARAHDFQTESARRMAHLARLAGAGAA